MAKMLVAGRARSRRGSTFGDALDAKWAAIQNHVTQINMDSPFMKLGFEGWKEFWGSEAFILRE